MSYIELNNLIKNIIEESTVVNSCYDMDATYAWNTRDVLYPSICFSLASATEYDDYTEFTYNWYAGDRQAEDIESTTNANYQELHDILKRIFIRLEKEGVEVVRPLTYYYAPVKQMDVLAIVTVSGTLRVPTDICLDS